MASILRVRNGNGEWIDIPALVGPKGDSYVLTEDDKAEIANEVLSELLSGDEVSY